MTVEETVAPARSAPPLTVWLALLGALTLWASAFVGISSALADFTPGAISLVRYAVSSVVAVLMWLAYSRRRREKVEVPARRDVWPIVASAFLVVVVYSLGINYGEQSVTPGTASFIAGQAPVFSILLAWLLLRERVAGRGWLGVGIGAAGVVLMLFADQSGGVQINNGSLFVLAATVGECLYFVLSKPLLERYSPHALNAWVTVAGTVMLLPYAGQALSSLASAPTSSILLLVYLGIFPGAVAYLLWNMALAHLSVTATTSSLYALPAITIVMSVLWVDKLPSTLGVIGGLVSLVGAGLVANRQSH
ncbi:MULTISPECIES: DMT family transporter [Streptomyces]|uniref:Putative DMT superfamily transporter inner membrane protein n=1 Tax=Streptomyces chartreusis NRRL 3882 TaxID=1079985 RepID=A0A2N9B251_STRCX|nr:MULTISPECIES: DMT family transporter [Streptomyces]MYS92336.1 EamA family transporter [Streptomyces sp. SID5464]SOR77404.1 putative DMT superfamily transporter inner membrane protein [Streptomyces chartreusis NRRL 3882]